MILKAKKICPVKPQKGSTPDPKLQLRLLCNCFFPCKTQSSTPKRTLFKVLGQIPADKQFCFELFVNNTMENHSHILRLYNYW